VDTGFAFDPFDRAQTHAVAETAQRLLREEPVLRMANGFVLVSRYDDARQVITNTKVFANSGGFRPTGLKVPIEDRSLGEIDPPEHAPLRRLAIGAAAGPGAVESLRAFTRETAQALLDPILTRGKGDLVEEFSVLLTNRVMAKMLGVPLDKSDWLAEQGEAVMASDMPVSNSTPRGFGYKASFPEFTDYIDDLVKERLANPVAVPDSISRIIDTAREVGDTPATTIIRMIVMQLLLGGSATTRDFLGNLFHELILKPELHAAIRADHALIPAAVEEGLRMAPPVLFVIRTCAVESELHGAPIHPGERVIAAIATANRDPAVYDDPHTFRLDRIDPAPHLSSASAPISASAIRSRGWRARRH